MSPISGQFEFLEHTADVLLRAWGPDLPALFSAAARGLYAVIGELTPRGPRRALPIELSAEGLDEVFREFLANLLFRFDAEGMVYDEITFDRIDATGLRAMAIGGPVDLDASDLRTEVKAVTYHALAVSECDGTWQGQVVLDI